MDRLLLLQNISVPIEQRDDSRVLPEVDRHVLQPGQVRPILPDAGALVVSDPDLLQDVPAHVEHDETLVAGTGVHARLSLGITAEIADHDTVGVIEKLLSLAPQLLPIVTPQRVADGNLIAAIAVYIDGIWV